MIHSDKDDSKLLIRCPECGQRFRVQPELRDRIVECGICEHRFRITDEVIVRVRKFYPGEARKRGLERFQRIPHAPPVNLPADSPRGYQPAQQAAYHTAPPPSAFEPVPPQRIIAGFLGVLAMVLMALLLIFGSEQGGLLDGIDQTRRLILASFVALVGFTLLIYANPRSRIPAISIGCIMSVALLSLPFFFQEGTDPIDGRDTAAVDPARETDHEDTPEEIDPETARIRELRESIGLRPLEREIDRLESADAPYRAYGLFLIGLRESNRIGVRDYIIRITGADPLSHIFPRDEGNYLFVVTGVEMNLERLAALASPLGEVRRILPEVHVAEIVIDNSIFIESDSEKLIRRDEPEFYELNLHELNSIDLHRVERAVLRLADAEPRSYRADITRRLHELFEEPGVNFHGAIARALAVWDQDTVAASKAATRAAVGLHERGTTAPADLVSLALKEPSESMVPVLVSQWRDNSTLWENHCIAMGPLIEEAMLDEFESSDGSSRQSAVRILSQTGGEASLAALSEAVGETTGELELIMRQAIETIQRRDSGS